MFKYLGFAYLVAVGFVSIAQAQESRASSLPETHMEMTQPAAQARTQDANAIRRDDWQAQPQQTPAEQEFQAERDREETRDRLEGNGIFPAR